MPPGPAVRLARLSLLRGALVAAVALPVLPSCDFTGSDGEDGPLGGSFSVTGDVVDFRSGEPVAGASLSTSGLLPPPRVTVEGTGYGISGIPANSAFQIAASAPPTYRTTFSAAVVLEEDDLEDVAVPVVSAQFLSGLVADFGVTTSGEKGILLARVVGADRQPRMNVAAASFLLAGAAPHFLDADMRGGTASATTASGWVAFFELTPGVVSLGQAATATVTLEMPTAPIAAGAVTLAEIVVTDGAPPLLSNVSFSRQVVPIFAARGCIACHSGKGEGKDRGGLDLGGGAAKIYRELLEEDPTRVVPGMPELSLVISMPSRESPPDRHPNITFTSASDPDFQKLYVWIKEGAKEN